MLQNIAHPTDLLFLLTKHQEAIIQGVTNSGKPQQIFYYLCGTGCWNELINILQDKDNVDLLKYCLSLLEIKLKSDHEQLTPQLLKTLTSFFVQSLKNEKFMMNAFQSVMCSCVALLFLHSSQQDLSLISIIDEWFVQHKIKSWRLTLLKKTIQLTYDDHLIITQQIKEEFMMDLNIIKKQVIIQLQKIFLEYQNISIPKLNIFAKILNLWVQELQSQFNTNIHIHPILVRSLSLLKQNTSNYVQTQGLILTVVNLLRNKNNFPQLYDTMDQYVTQFEALIGILNEDQKKIKQKFIWMLCIYARATRVYLLEHDPEKMKTIYNKILNILETVNKGKQTSTIFMFLKKFLLSLSQNFSSLHSQFHSEMKRTIDVLQKIISFTKQQLQEFNHKSLKTVCQQNQQVERKCQLTSTAYEVIIKITQIISPKVYVEHIKNKIDNIQAQDENYWPCIEFCITYLTNLDIDKCPIISQNPGMITEIIQNMLEMDFPYKVVKKIFIQFLAEMMVLYSQSNTVISSKILKFISNFIIGSNKDEYNLVKKVIDKISEQNPAYVLNNFQQFVEIYKNGKYSQFSMESIMKPLSTDQQKLNIYLPELFEYALGVFNESDQLLNRKKGVMLCLGIFRQIVKQDPQSYAEMLSQWFYKFWKAVKPIFQKKCNNKKQVIFLEQCAKTMKYGFRALKGYCEPYLQEIFQTIIDCYQKYPVSSYVYLVEVFSTIFGYLTNSRELIKKVFDKSVEISLGYLGGDIEDQQCLVEDIIGMVNRFIRLIPQIANNCQNFQKIVHQIYDQYNFNEQIIEHISSFTLHLYMQYWSTQEIQKWFEKMSPVEDKIKQWTPQMIESRQKNRMFIISIAPDIVKKTLSIINLQFSSRRKIAYFIDIFLSPIKAFPEQMKSIWQKQLESLPHGILLNSEKQQFLSSISAKEYWSVEILITTLLRRKFNHGQTAQQPNQNQE